MRLRALLVASLLLLGCAAPAATVSVGEVSVRVDVAATPEARTRGLGGRATLADDSGMWFIFDTPAVQSFWMKDMHFPIDILWVVDEKVVGVEANVPIPTTTTLLIYSSPEAVDRVLEVSAGWTLRHGVRVGDPVRFDSR